MSVSHVVLLIHGIRDWGGGWQGEAKRIIEKDAEFCVLPIKLGYYDALSFLAPREDCEKAYSSLLSTYEQAVNRYPHAKISVIAHSFGTYLIGKLVSSNPDTKLHRIILCGSVLKAGFPWFKYKDQIGYDVNTSESSIVLNECGTNDLWPFLAELARSRYGTAGRHGFQESLDVHTNWYNGGHSLFFHPDHISLKWVPFLINGNIPEGNAVEPLPTTGERIVNTIPWVRLIPHLLVTLSWVCLKYPFIPALIIGLFVWLAFQMPKGEQVSLGDRLRDLRTVAASSLREGGFEDFNNEILRFYKDPDGKYHRISFDDAVILDAGPRPGNGEEFQKLELAPTDCDWFATPSENRFVVRMTIKASQLPYDPSVLKPLEEKYVRISVEGATSINAILDITRRTAKQPGGFLILDASDGKVSIKGIEAADRFQCEYD